MQFGEKPKNHLSPPENSWDWWSLHPIPRSCHPFLKGIRGIPGSFPPKKSILDLSTHSDQPLFFGGGEGKRFMSVNDRFFAPERDQLLCWGHLWPVVQHGSNWVVTSIIASNCFWVAKTLVHNVFLERNPINFHYPIVWQDTTYCITFTGHFQGFLFCPLREYGFNMALLKETNGQWALNRALSLGGGGSLGEHSLTSHQLEAEAVGTLVFQPYLPREDRCLDSRTASEKILKRGSKLTSPSMTG